MPESIASTVIVFVTSFILSILEKARPPNAAGFHIEAE
jgi:hypothetical protein